MNNIPEWLKELYIAVLRFKVPCDQLSPHKYYKDNWTFLTMPKGRSYVDTQDFINRLQDTDDTYNPNVRLELLHG